MRTKPVKQGAYALIIKVNRHARVRIGQLGHLRFRPGVYVYVGSAMNSLDGRISRYHHPIRKKHWHIDYLLSSSIFSGLAVAVKVTSRRIECEISRAVQREAVSKIEGFGCSDCDCESHLHYFSRVSEAHRTLSQLGLDIIPPESDSNRQTVSSQTR